MDARDTAHLGRWWKAVNGRTATVEIDDGREVSVPVEYEVCPTCGGAGSYVNPSIDSHGISAEEFYEDREFAEFYVSGIFDIQCVLCRGQNVVPVCMDEEVARRIEEDIQFKFEYAAEVAAERARGA